MERKEVAAPGVHVESYEPPLDEVRARAHELWLERGCPQGDPETDWFTARTQLRCEFVLRQAQPGSRPAPRMH